MSIINSKVELFFYFFPLVTLNISQYINFPILYIIFLLSKVRHQCDSTLSTQGHSAKWNKSEKGKYNLWAHLHKESTKNNQTPNTEVIGGCQKARVGKIVKVVKGTNFKRSKSWGCNMEQDDYSVNNTISSISKVAKTVNS